MGAALFWGGGGMVWMGGVRAEEEKREALQPVADAGVTGRGGAVCQAAVREMASLRGIKTARPSSSAARLVAGTYREGGAPGWGLRANET